MKRVGYDADTQTYYYRDRSGILYQGSGGAQYGELRPGRYLCPAYIVQRHRPFSGRPISDDSLLVSDAPVPIAGTLEEDLEAAPTHRDGYAPLPTDEVK